MATVQQTALKQVQVVARRESALLERQLSAVRLKPRRSP